MSKGSLTQRVYSSFWTASLNIFIVTLYGYGKSKLVPKPWIDVKIKVKLNLFSFHQFFPYSEQASQTQPSYRSFVTSTHGCKL